MTHHDDEVARIRAALVADAVEADGPLRLQKRFHKAREALPTQGLEDVAAHVINPALIPRGHALCDELATRGITVTTLLDPVFPRLLREIPDPPLVLFSRGNLSALDRPAVAVVGARKHTAYGGGVAGKLAAELARMGFTVVSGLARGIDTRAHEAALAVNGLTAAVLGCGPDHIYPRENSELARRLIHEGGVVISEFPPGSPIKPFHFPIRNRLISGLCHATVVVEAEARSGSLSTARHCLDQGRELFAVPGRINEPTAAGTNGLIARGEARLLTDVAQVVAELCPLLGLAAEGRRRVEAAIDDPVARRIFDSLDAYQPMAVDVLSARLELPIGPLTAHLTELETRGLVERLPGTCYLRNPVHDRIAPPH